MKQGLVTAIFVAVVALSASAQNYYTGRTDVYSSDGTRYLIKDYSEKDWRIKSIYIKYEGNYLRDDYRYKLDSTSGEYYSWATGMGTFADVNDSIFYACVRQVFTEEEIARYSAVPSSSILVKFAVNPETGQVWEVEYDITFENDRTFLSIPIDKFHALENALKSHPVCSISEKLRQERQSYAITNCTLF